MSEPDRRRYTPNALAMPDRAGAGTRVASSLPYPWPYDGPIVGERLALIRCGWQHHWADMSHDVPDVVARLAKVADAVNAMDGLVIDLRHGWLNRPLSLVRPGLPAVGSVAWRLYGSHGPVDGRGLTIDAAGIDGCYESRLEGQLRASGRDCILLGGFAAEATVHSTMRSLNDRGFECLIIGDACASIDPYLLQRLLHSTTMSGSAVGETAALIAALAERAQ
jgi:biuret amidohydrolase